MIFSKIKAIQFQGFRGLGANTCTVQFDGKNVLIVGGNGKGKSSIADGIELFFQGAVSHLEDASSLPNVYATNDPKISIWPRSGDPSVVDIPKDGEPIWTPPEQGGFAGYPSAESFILRRNRLLAFIQARPGDRFKEFMALLGMDNLERQKEAFKEAHNEAKLELDRVQQLLQGQLEQCSPPDGDVPKSLVQGIQAASELAVRIDLPAINSVDDIPTTIELLSQKIGGADQVLLDKVSLGLASLSPTFPPNYEEELIRLEEAYSDVEQALENSVDGEKGAIINEGIIFFEKHPNENLCPLCGNGVSPGELLDDLRQREESLANLRSAQSRKRMMLARFSEAIAKARDNYHEVLESCAEHFSSDGEKELWGATHAWLKHIVLEGVEQFIGDNNEAFNQFADGCQLNRGIAEKLQEELQKEKKSLEKRLDGDIVGLHVSLTMLNKHAKAIESIEEEVAAAKRFVSLADRVKKTYNKAYSKSLSDSLQRFKGKVLKIYNFLHEGCGEAPECKDISLAPQQGRAWLLRLGVDFLGVVDANPELFLSEGHLDSLGLAVYLAAVQEFNPKGTLLVLDDVVSSIDRDHQDRIAELLAHQFQDYQLLVTTHDERWGKILLNKADALGAKKSWIATKYGSWTPETGPTLTTLKGNWDHIQAALTEERYLTLGSLLRIVTESFMKRMIVRFQISLPYKVDNRYTIKDLLDFSKPSESNVLYRAAKKASTENGLNKPTKLKQVLAGALMSSQNGHPALKKERAEQLVMRVFGVDNLINELSHDSPNLSDVGLGAVRDFALSLKEAEEHCVACGYCSGEPSL
ncbi:AAA family ATPase [Pseudodesulfovibrio sediminis]|uniref:Rad50/SbcC-type AAA domain-containing protein n=1 Tax=Pseudodesulfovibrio sediminis TaxID=2810563 RepID=A0ABN6EX08_9BACT|nr:AAA family ATPase [Pseudodesulfovibrio sediminis]BCS90067.1 hypothetical protein PSDVSF_33090 [Pseudodesulfovibrio sediminis]